MNSFSSMQRRGLLAAGGALALSGVVSRRAEGAAKTASRQLKQFSYSDVSLLEGPALRQQRATHAALMAMNEDALLKPFRQRAGLSAPGPDLGGWYNFSERFVPGRDMHGFILGHSFGQYVSALARLSLITGDAATRAKVARLVERLRPTLVTGLYAHNYALPCYTYDKIAVGLIDAFAFARIPGAMALLGKATDAALPWFPEKALTRPEMRARPHVNEAQTWDESYTLPENLYRAAGLGGGDRYRTLARRYLLDGPFFDPLAAGENVLPGKHGYSHVNALSSAMQAYFVEGSEKHLRAARNGLDFVLAQSFATGGWAPNESFVKPGEGALGSSLSTTHQSFEASCGTYGHFKAGRYLIAATGESRWGDAMERLLYNAALSVLPLKPDGTAFYYADYNDIGSKTYFEYQCPCCSGTIGQLVADYGISAYFHDDAGVFLNLFLPSEVRWEGVTLAQHTAYPAEPRITFTVATPKRRRFALRFRIPEWAATGTTLRVNGRPSGASVRPGHFAEVIRTWSDGDKVDLAFAMPFRLERVDHQTARKVALMRGPLALFQSGEQIVPFRTAELVAAVQDGTAPRWTVATDSGEKTFQPYFAIEPSTPTRLYQAIAE